MKEHITQKVHLETDSGKKNEIELKSWTSKIALCCTLLGEILHGTNSVKNVYTIIIIICRKKLVVVKIS
jgi:hypothetical protein